MTGPQIRFLRVNSGLTQSDLAGYLEVYPQTISYWEHGREPSTSELIRISKFFDVPIDWLVGNDSRKDTVPYHIYIQARNEINHLQNKLREIQEIIGREA